VENEKTKEARRARVVAVDGAAPEPAALVEAAEVLRAGGLVAFPTETVYGLGARALSSEHVARIYAAKGRPGTNPLIVHVASLAEARQVAVLNDLAIRIGTVAWPGPLTLVLPKQPGVPDNVTAGGATVAVRVPAHPVALGLLRVLGEPIAAPSANRSQELSPTTAAHVIRSLGERVDLVLDGGPTDRGIESTVIDLTGDRVVVLRPGSLPRDELRALLAAAGARLEASSSVALDGPVARSPGLMDRHYAPHAKLLVVPTRAIGQVLADEGRGGQRVRVLAYSALYGNGLSLPAHPQRYAAKLYAALHELDATSDVIVVEEPPAGEAWEAVHDRLRRASFAGEPL
jgi:L-threonylcarbamoyladenylate synthase